MTGGGACPSQVSLASRASGLSCRAPRRGRRGPQRGRRRSYASRAGLRATRLLLRFEHPTPRLLRRRPKDPHRSRGLHPFRGRGRYPFVSAPGKPPPRSLRRHAQRHLPMAEHVLLELRPGSVASRVRSLPLTLHTHRRRAVRLGRVGGRLRPHACGVSSRQRRRARLRGASPAHASLPREACRRVGVAHSFLSDSARRHHAAVAG